MNVKDEKADCPFCGKPEMATRFCFDKNVCEYNVNCVCCGVFVLTPSAHQQLNIKIKNKSKIRTLLCERKIAQRQSISIISDDENISGEFKYTPMRISALLSKYPVHFLEKVDRTIRNLGNFFTNGGDRIYAHNELFFAIYDREKSIVSDLMVEAEYITIDKMDNGRIKLLLKGWERFMKLSEEWEKSNKVFVAMWFDKELKKYRESVESAIKQAGYESCIIDTHPHNNYIMDEVINQINESRFVIADFTCAQECIDNASGHVSGGVRGGVYFEAGYAKGTGRQVIATCRDDNASEKRRHFDISQFNTIFWHEKDGKLTATDGIDFIRLLSERIKATIGSVKN